MTADPYTVIVGKGLSRHLPARANANDAACQTGRSGQRRRRWDVPGDGLPPCGRCRTMLDAGTHPNLPDDLRTARA